MCPWSGQASPLKWHPLTCSSPAVMHLMLQDNSFTSTVVRSSMGNVRITAPMGDEGCLRKSVYGAAGDTGTSFLIRDVQSFFSENVLDLLLKYIKVKIHSSKSEPDHTAHR